MRLVSCLIAVSAVLLLSQSRRPNLSGVWEVDTARSNFGRMPAPEMLCDHIQHRGPRLVISSVMKQHHHEMVSTLEVTSDGAENLNRINGREFRARGYWERGKLVIVVRDPEGHQMTELRYLSADGRSQIVESYVGAPKGKPLQRRVMIRRVGQARSLPFTA